MAIRTLSLWSSTLSVPLFEMTGDTLISSTSGTKLAPDDPGGGLGLPAEEAGETEPREDGGPPDGDRPPPRTPLPGILPRRPGRLSRIRDLGRCGSGETRLE